MDPAVQTLIVLAVMAVLFVTEIIPLAITSMGGAIAVGLLGIIPRSQVFSGLSNSTVVLFAGMFVIGGAMFHTGLAQKIGITVVEKAGKSENALMFSLMAVTAVMSSVLSNTGTAAALLPVVLGICAAAKIPASRQLMPMAFAASIGGIITLVGTPPNIIANGALQAAGLRQFGFFEFAWIGIPLTIAAILFMMLIGKRFLPKHILSADVEVEQEVENVSNDPKKMLYAGIILLIVVIDMALSASIKWLPSLSMAAIIGAILCVLTGCLKEKEAYISIDWVTIFLFAGMMPVATAMDKSGAGKLIADTVIAIMGDNPSPYFATAVLFLLSCILTQFMSNTASCALLAPIGIAIAQGMGASPHAVLMAIAVAASCAFATPVGTPPNTIVLGPGEYSFMDYVKAGIPLIVVCFVVSLVIIPMVWPFF
ncbi:SLC13 family permease [Veillonella magna]|uniref:SLC13/DASS family transporter n=1 Tax=Veillonella magna TaxID=464322 RepID=A0ABS2GDE8_9FIRM|nr:SLC13 family permease [Veillonella magna]MBM6823656.1 SLC13/DASS family transporter [Veillonella magna]MBM6912186.1 SLC13/DASS family transporter [Veillonella magna]